MFSRDHSKHTLDPRRAAREPLGHNRKWGLLAVLLWCLLPMVAQAQGIRIVGNLEQLLSTEKAKIPFIVNPETWNMSVSTMPHPLQAEKIGADSGSGYVRGWLEPQSDGSWVMNFENVQDYNYLPNGEVPNFVQRWQGAKRAQTISDYISRLRLSDDAEPLVRRARALGGQGVRVAIDGAVQPNVKLFAGGRPAIESGKPAPEAGKPPTTAAGDVRFTDPVTQQLYEKLRDRPPAQMDLNFFKEVYGTPDATRRLKEIFGLPVEPFPEKSRRLGVLRKFYEYLGQAEYARDHGVYIENTNQGKENGARSDLDLTTNFLDFDETTGKLVMKGDVNRLIDFQKQRYQSDGLTAPEKTDVTIFNGESWLPDWRDSRLSYDEFKRETIRNVFDLRNQKGAYFVPGANKEQTHDRALAEGRTVHIGWDPIKDRPTLNGRPFEFDPVGGEIVDAERKTPLVEFGTRTMAQRGHTLRYEGVESVEAPDAWRRSFGNVVQNTNEFLLRDDPAATTDVGRAINRNKYFIERIIDQGVGRFTDVYRVSYVDVHGSALPDEKKQAWKRRFIQKAFGIPANNTDRIKDIQRVLDRSAEIHLDSTGKWHDGHKANYSDRVKQYFADELPEVEQKFADWYQDKPKPPDYQEQILKEAERRFVEKQRGLMIESAVRTLEESFRRDFTRDGRERFNRKLFSQPEVAKKIMFERGVELALLMDIIETAPNLTRVQRDLFRQRVVNAIPVSAQPLVAKLAELSGLKMKLVGRAGLEPWTKSRDQISDLRPTELMAQVEQEMRALLGDADPKNVALEKIRQAIYDAIVMNLGPKQRAEFFKAWEAGKLGLAKLSAAAGGAYWNAIKEQADFLMVTGAAFGMIHAYQLHCEGQTTWTNECLSGLGWEAGNQALYMLPGINSGFMILTGVHDISQGKAEGFIPLTLGVLSLPPVAQSAFGVGSAPVIKVYIAYMILKTGYAVTVGYASQKMENDLLEQAFKALPEGIPPARRYEYPGAPTFGSLQALTPDVPLLWDVIKVPANAMSDDERFELARTMFAKDVEAELAASGLTPDTAAWRNERLKIIRRHAAALPYVQRNQKIYEYFHPLVSAEGTEFPTILANCVQAGTAKVEEKYKAPPSFWNQLRYWYDEKNKVKDREAEIGAVWSSCLQRAASERNEGPALERVFNKYLDSWFRLQDSPTGKKFREKYDTDDARTLFRRALINQYLVQRYLDTNREAATEEMKKAARISGEASDAAKRIWGNILFHQEAAAKESEKNLTDEAVSAYTGAPQEVSAQFKLKAPDFAVRLGQQRAQIDIAARGQYYHDNEARNDWRASLSSEIVSAAMERPGNVVMTKDLEDELKAGANELSRQFVKITEKISGELQYAGGQKLAAETTVDHFDILPWEGALTVEVRGARKNTTDLNDPAQLDKHWNAVVKISGPAQAEQTVTRPVNEIDAVMNPSDTTFQKLPAGSYSIHVEPAPGDKEHKAADGTATLIDFTAQIGWAPDPNRKEDQEWRVLTMKRYEKYQDGAPVESSGKDLALVRWKDRATVIVVLPYVEPPKPPEKPPEKIEEPPKPEKKEEPPKKEDQQKPPLPPTPPGQTGQRPDPRALAECQALLNQAQQALAAGDTAGAAALLEQARQKNCGGLDPNLNKTLAEGQKQIDDAANKLINEAQQNLNAAACEYEAAWEAIKQLRQINPAHPALAGININQISGYAAAQHEARVYLRAGKEAIERKDLDGAIAGLTDALNVRGLPDCMRPPMIALKNQLERHREFIGLTREIEEATRQCEFDKAQQLVGRITRMTPRYDFVTDWMNTELPKLSDLLQRRQQALQLIKEAEGLSNQAASAAATDPVDWNRVGQLVQQVMNKLAEADRVAPKCLKERSQMDALRQKCRDLLQKKPAPIQTSIILLIDTSGSMGQNNKINNAKAAARAAVQNASKTTEISVMNFDGGCTAASARVAADFTTDINRLVQAIETLKPGGGTPMFLATAYAVEIAKARVQKGSSKSALVILMSDGGDTCGDAEKTKAADAIRTSNIPVNTIGYDVGDQPGAVADLNKLATLTNGRSYTATTADPKEIVNAFKLAMLPSLFKDFERAEAGTSVQSHFDAAKSAIQRQDLNTATYQLQQAQQLAPNSAAVSYNLALVNEANDKPLAAVRNAQNYLKLAPDAPDRADVEARIAQMQKEAQANPRAEYDPAACRDVYNWALAEREAAKKSGNPARLQTVLEIQIAAQRGDCAKARQLQDRYRQQFP